MTKPKIDSPFEPPKKKTMELLKECARKVGLYAVLNLVLFWWQNAGYLDAKTAVPAMWVCALLGGVAFGKFCVIGYKAE